MEYVDLSEHVACFLTDGYFESKNCFRELLRAVLTSKTLIIMLEAEPGKHGGLGWHEIDERVRRACLLASSDFWDLQAEIKQWDLGPGASGVPSPDELLQVLKRCYGVL